MIISRQQIEEHFAWNAPQRIMTKKGNLVDLRKAPDRPASRQFFNDHRDQLRSHGVRLADKYGEPGKLEFVWWIEIAPEVLKSREVAMEKSKAAKSNFRVPMPPGLSLYPYQVVGVEYAIEAFKRETGCLIADEMGLGKTAQAIGVVNASPTIHKILVVVPASIIGNWVREIFRFQVRKMTVGIVDGDSFPQTEWVVMSYSMAHKWRQRTQSMMWDLVVLDECQRISNPQAQMTKAIVGWRPRIKNEGNVEDISSGIPTKRKLAMSGTPINNRPKEFFSVMSWLDPKRWPASSYGSFAFKFCGAAESIKRGQGWTDDGASNLSVLQTELRSTIMIRRLKNDVLTDLPPKTRQIFRLQLDRQTRIALERSEQSVSQLLERSSIAMNSSDPEQLDRLAKALETMNPMDLAAASEARRKIGIAKLGPALDHILSALSEIDKVIVFAHHKEVITGLIEGLSEYQPIAIHGSVDVKDRQALVDRFNTNPKCRVAVMSVRAGGVGFNMTSASLVVMVEADWTPGYNMQCEDRAHRIGQSENVLVHYLVADESCDASIVAAVVRKMAVLENTLNRIE